MWGNNLKEIIVIFKFYLRFFVFKIIGIFSFLDNRRYEKRMKWFKIYFFNILGIILLIKYYLNWR